MTAAVPLTTAVAAGFTALGVLPHVARALPDFRDWLAGDKTDLAGSAVGPADPLSNADRQREVLRDLVSAVLREASETATGVLQESFGDQPEGLLLELSPDGAFRVLSPSPEAGAVEAELLSSDAFRQQLEHLAGLARSLDRLPGAAPREQDGGTRTWQVKLHRTHPGLHESTA